MFWRVTDIIEDDSVDAFVETLSIQATLKCQRQTCKTLSVEEGEPGEEAACSDVSCIT